MITRARTTAEEKRSTKDVAKKNPKLDRSKRVYERSGLGQKGQSLLQLQRTHGNQTVQRWVKDQSQPKPKTRQPDRTEGHESEQVLQRQSARRRPQGPEHEQRPCTKCEAKDKNPSGRRVDSEGETQLQLAPDSGKMMEPDTEASQQTQRVPADRLAIEPAEAASQWEGGATTPEPNATAPRADARFAPLFRCGCSSRPRHQRAGSGGPSRAAEESPLHTGLVPQIANSVGKSLPLPLQMQAETVFGTDLGRVRLHDGGAAASAARQVAARAFTVGDDIYFGSGRLQTNASEGLRLLGHELTHVVQQRRGLSRASLRGAGGPYETEADEGARAFVEGRPMRVSTATGGASGIQRFTDPESEAELVGTEDSPHGLPFLGEASTPAELRELMRELAAEEGVETLALVPEDEAFPAPTDGDLVASGGAAGPLQEPAQAPVQASSLLKHLRTTRSPAPLQAQSENRPIQRATVAGCHVPGLTPGQIGILAHQQIQSACATTSDGCRGEVTIPGDGRMDLLRQHIPANDEIGEIKPASWLGRGWQSLAQAQLAFYIAGWSAHTGLPAVPMWSFSFPGGSFFGNPSQMLTAWGPSNGVYYYRCGRTRGRRRRVRVRVRVPVPVPVPVPVTPVVPVPVPDPDRPRVTGEDVVKVGAGIGIGYLIYRGVRLIPSLFPPAWPTIPANLAVP